MTGDTVVIEGVEFQVIWNGEEGLIPARQTKITGAWAAPKRIYNKTGRHSRKIDNQEVSIDNSIILGEANGREGTTGFNAEDR